MNDLILNYDRQLDERLQNDLEDRVSESFGVDPGIEYAIKEMNKLSDEEEESEDE